MTEIQRRKRFQWVKSLSTEKFWQYQNEMHSRAYFLAEKHYQEALAIVLQPKQAAAVIAKAEQIREQWDGLTTITIDDTEESA